MNGHLYFSNMSRRQLLAKTGQAALALAGGLSLEAILNCCAGTSTEMLPTNEATVVYPPLKGHKTQPPENGCLVGLMRDYTLVYRVDMLMEYYQEKLGKKPAFYTLCCAIPFNLFPANRAIMLAQQGVIPNLIPEFSGFTLEEFAKGEADQAFKDVAQEAVQYGQQYGGFFYTPMPEINLGRHSWGGQPTQAKKTWQHVWQIFEDNGANKYATWVWEVITPECTEGIADPPNPYYPGDKYVDWIGLSTYSRNQFGTGNMSYNQLSAGTYHEMLRTHHDKPIMQAEFGKTQSNEQPYWIKNAYKTIKSRGMKAALYWDYPDTALRDNLYLSQESLAALKEILKDPYWITAK
jgi:hypothetical protein